MKPRILVLHTESIFSRGGEKYIFEILKRLTGDFEVNLYLERISPAWEQVYTASGVSVYKLWRPPAFYWILLPVSLCVNYLILKWRIRNNDVVFSTNFPLNFLAMLISKKTICHCFEPLAIFYDQIRISSLSPFSRLCVRIAKLLYSPLDKLAIKKCAILTTLNHEVREYILLIHKRAPDAYLSNGIDTNFFSPKRKVLFKRNKKDFVIAHSTDYTVFKGTEQLIESLRILKDRKNVRVIISESIHDEEVKQYYLTLLHKYNLNANVSFVGLIPEKELPGFYSSADVFCYTASSRCAGGSTASLSVLEAQSCGLPVIRSIGNADEIKPGITGYFVDPFQPKDVARAIIRMKNASAFKYDNMSKSARKYVLEKFTWEKTANTIKNLILNLYE